LNGSHQQKNERGTGLYFHLNRNKWGKVDVFICEFCGEPVELEDSVR
jgi:hypothetical protein